MHGFDFKTGTNGWIVTASGVLIARIAREHVELIPVFEEARVTPLAASSVAATLALFDGQSPREYRLGKRDVASSV